MNLQLSILLFFGIMTSAFVIIIIIEAMVNKENRSTTVFVYLLITSIVWSIFYYLS